MTDLSKTIAARSDILNADDLLGGSITVKITKVSLCAGEQPIAINYEGDAGKPFMPCKTMRRVLVHIWGSDGNKYVGRLMTLYRDDTVTFGGAAVGGVRKSAMSGIDKSVTVSLTATKKSKKPCTIQPIIEKTDPELDVLKTAGKNAASKGIDALTAWKGSLTAPQKLKLGKEFGEELTKIAGEIKP